MKLPFTICFLLGLMGFVEAQETAQPCPGLEAVTIDGIAADWSMPWVKDEENVFSYNVCADSNNLYVRVKTNDYFAKRKMAAFGFTLWIDANGKKKKKLGLRFPLGGAEAEERAAVIRAEGGPGVSAGEQIDYQKEIDRRLIADLELMELIGLADNPLTSTRSGITNGIKVAIAMDSEDAYIYEALIPFKSFRLSRAGMSKIAIGFETGRYVVPKAKNNPNAGAMTDYTNPQQMSRMQGYQGMRGNPKLTYTTYAWTTLELK